MVRNCIWVSLLLLLGTNVLTAQRDKGFDIRNPYIKSVKIPVEIFNNLILVQVRINNSFPLYFIIDTGVKTTLMTEPVILNFVKMDEMTPIRVRGLGAGDLIEAELARNLKIELPNGIIGRNMRMIVLPEGAVSYSAMFGRPVVGILGADLFKDFVVEVNYYREYIRLIRRDAFRPKKSYAEIPIEVIKSKPYIKGILTTKENDTLETRWLMDTGSSQSISVYNRSISPPEQSLDAFIGQGLSGSMFGKIGRISSFSMGDFAFKEVIAGFPDTTSLRWVREGQDHYSNVGSGILSRFSIIFDYQGGKIYMRKNPKFSESFEYNTCGLETMAYGQQFDNYFISYVRPNSPAEEADVRIGDKILSINGYDVSDLEIGELTARLNRKAGRKLCLRLIRGDEKIKRCFVLESAI
jgi:hypothetical protein